MCAFDSRAYDVRTMRKKQAEREQANGPGRPPSRSNGSIFAAFFVLSILACLVVFGIMLGKRDRPSQGEGEQEKLEQPEDPFAGMTYSDDKNSKKGGGRMGIFVGFESDAELWLRARDVFNRADELLVQSAELRSQGDASWRAVSIEAKGLCEEAVQRGAVWRKVLVDEVGESSSQVKLLDKTLQKWRRTSAILRKTVSR